MALWSALVAAICDLAFVGVLGASFVAGLMPREWRAAPGMPRRLAWGACAAAVVLIVGNLLRLWTETAVMSNLPPQDALSVVPVVLTRTRYGLAWLIGFAGAIALVLSSGGVVCRLAEARGAAHGQPRHDTVAGWRVAIIIAAILVASGKAATTHAAGAGDFSVAECVHAVHILATTSWAGMVIAAALVLLSPRERSDPALRVFVGRLSDAALVSALLVMATGAYDGWRGTGGMPIVLVSSLWGRVLVFKLILVLAALVLGGINRFIQLPKIDALLPDALRHVAEQRFAKVLLVEAVLMICIVAAAALLSQTPPGAVAGALH